jgi:hypothetical protein
MLQLTSRRATQRAAWLGRRRWQLLGALLLAAAVPVLVRLIISPSTLWYVSTPNAFFANIAAVTIAFWLRLSFEPYPGIQSSYVILPTAGAAHAAVLAFFFFTRLPYDRLGFVLGFFLHTAWFYLVYFLVQRRVRLRIAVVPFGSVSRCPRSSRSIGCDCPAHGPTFCRAATRSWRTFRRTSHPNGRASWPMRPWPEASSTR